MLKKFFLAVTLVSTPSLLFSQTQFELNQKASKELAATDKKLNDIYHKILKKYAKNKSFIKNLKLAQLSWIKFRDAQLAMKFPDASTSHYGSVITMCEDYYLAELTEDRIKQLQDWLKPHEEGDVCLGSVEEYDPAED